MLSRYVNTNIFLITFILSLIVVYMVQPEAKIVYKFPTPENAGKLTYQNSDKSCYKYEAVQVKCPSDPNLILEHPIILK